MRFFGFLALFTLIIGCGERNVVSREISVIPMPVSAQLLGGDMAAKDTVGRIEFLIDEDLSDNPEAYSMVVKDTKVKITGSTKRSLPLAIATLEQLVDKDNRVPYIKVFDEPAFEWRGVMIDVARHFFPCDSILKIIDILSYHKINKLHLHLTDDIGWRVEIDAYPELTRRGAWRVKKDESVPFVDFQMSHKGAKNTVGGYYTKEDIKKIVEYAATKHIEVIPEIDMPGHSGAALECYPEYICQGLESSNIYCVGNDSTYIFLKTILSEVGKMFPSEYLHIGGDEVAFSVWDKCPKCSALKDNGRDIGYLFVERINKIAKGIGKTIIGWDEITHEKLDEKIMVMSWTGWKNGVKAAEQGNKVIMTPLDYVYFDHLQSQNDGEPQAWGGNNSLQRVWSFPVMPFDVPPSAKENILGGQANLWTENIETISHLEYMLLPRLSGLSEALWRSNRSMNGREWDEFLDRIEHQFERYRSRGWNFSESSATPMAVQRGDSIILSAENYKHPIYYTTDGTLPKIVDSLKYSRALKFDTLTTLRAQAFRNSVPFGRELIISNLNHLAVGGKVTYNTLPSQQYIGDGEDALINDLRASKRGDDPRWVGWEKSDMILTIDLGEVKDVEQVIARFLQCTCNTSVILPTWIRVSVSFNNKDFTVVRYQQIPSNPELNAFIHTESVEFKRQGARFIKIEAGNVVTLPLGIPRGGGNAWIFTDEIVVK